MASKNESCPHAKSDTTPCWNRDGDVVIVNPYGKKVGRISDICVGCDKRIAWLRKKKEEADAG